MRRALLVSLAALLVSPVMATVPAAAEEPVDDTLQITLNRLAAEAPLFGSFRSCTRVSYLDGTCDISRNISISVIRLDDGHHAEVSGDKWQVSASAVKALWVAAATGKRGVGAVEDYTTAIFKHSSNTSKMIDLMGSPLTKGVNAINEKTYEWGLGATFLRGWYGGRYSTYVPWTDKTTRPWGRNNFTTTDDLTTFWALLGKGELLDESDTAQVLEWAAINRSSGPELIVPRLPTSAEASYKSGWLGSSSLRRISGALVTAPGGIRYATAIAVQSWTSSTYYNGALDFARYASCEIYNEITGGDATCTRSGDPSTIINHTTAPIGLITSAEAERDRLRVAGWGLDRDSGEQPIEVKIAVDGKAVGTVTADQKHIAVGEREGLGFYHGFRVDLPVDLAPGERRVCAVGINDSGTGPNREVDCETVDVPADHPPRGELATAAAKPGRIHAGGWAKDADTGGPINVKIFVDGTRIRTVAADRGTGGHGFWAAPAIDLPAGDHEVCALAINFENAGPNRDIGCSTITVPEDWPPIGNLAKATLSGANLTVSGKAFDPDTADPITVRIEWDDSPVATLTADRGASGTFFRGVIPVSPNPGEDHEVCGYGANPSGGEFSLGCKTMTAP